MIKRKWKVNTLINNFKYIIIIIKKKNKKNDKWKENTLNNKLKY